MNHVINLNKFRKKKAKAEHAKQAETNRRWHGRTKAERAREELQKKQLVRIVDGARRDPPPEPEPGAASEDPETG
jgi:hypothetical protein